MENKYMGRPAPFLDFPEHLHSWRKFLPYVLLLAVTLCLYLPSLYFDFVWDDTQYIKLNYSIQGFTGPQLRQVWTGVYLGHYAPIHHTFLALVYQIAGADPFIYHLAQVLLHAACVLLLYLVLTNMESPRIALLSSLLFAVHPTGVETVAWISETKSTLAFLFFLLSFLAFLRLRERGGWGFGILCAVFLVLSVLSKVSTVVAPAVFLLWDYRERRSFDSKTIGSLAAFFLISLAMAAIHLTGFRETQWGSGSPYFGGPWTHFMNLPLLIFFYIQMTLVPYPLSAWYIFPVTLEFTWTLAALWAALISLSALLLRSNRRIQFWGLWFLVFLTPVLQLIPVGIWVADRYLYIPIIGLFVLATGFFFDLIDRFGRTRPVWAWQAAMCVVLAVFAWRTLVRLPVWRDDVTLWETTYSTCANAAYCNESLGLSLLNAGQLQRGGDLLVRAVELSPDPIYLVNLADALALNARNYSEAVRFYELALGHPGSISGIPVWVTDAYAGLGRAHLLQGNLEQAALAVEKGKRLTAANPRLWVVEGFLYWKLGDLEAARKSLSIALIITGQRSHAAPFLTYYWGDSAEVGRLLADLHAAALAREAENSSE